MNVVVRKMMKATGLERPLAEKLVGAGYRTPGRVEDATDKALLAIPGVGKAALQTIRQVLPQR